MAQGRRSAEVRHRRWKMRDKRQAGAGHGSTRRFCRAMRVQAAGVPALADLAPAARRTSRHPDEDTETSNDAVPGRDEGLPLWAAATAAARRARR